jgi:hypothetical protein
MPVIVGHSGVASDLLGDLLSRLTEGLSLTGALGLYEASASRCLHTVRQMLIQRYVVARPHDQLDHVRVEARKRVAERCGVPGLIPIYQALVEGMLGAPARWNATPAGQLKLAKAECDGVVKRLQRSYSVGESRIR